MLADPDGDRVILELMREELNLDAVLETYAEERGFPPYHPVMMTALLFFSYTQGRSLTRGRLPRACQTRFDFMAVTAMQQPDFRTINKFRLRHLEALASLFGQVLHLCQRAGMVKLLEVIRAAMAELEAEANLRELKRRRVSAYIAVGRQKAAPATKPKRGPPTGPMSRAMRKKLRLAGHRSRYRLRKPAHNLLKLARRAA